MLIYPNRTNLFFLMGRQKHQVVLPSYKLDSNLILIPGIIYNVTFSRFKAAALLSRFQRQIHNVPLVENLLNEYDFGEAHAPALEDLPGVLSDDAVAGISSFFEHEQKFKKDDAPKSDFDWLVLAIAPNLSKIRDPSGAELYDLYGDIVTIVRIVGIIDDTSNIKLTLQALTRGRKTKTNVHMLRTNEVLVNVDWLLSVHDISAKQEQVNEHIKKLFKAIDVFVVDYRQALAIASKKGKPKDKILLTLNPLANALYLQLAGSKDFSKAYLSLQKITGNLAGKTIDTKNFLRLLDLVSAIVPFPNHEKLKVLNSFDPSTRVDEVCAMMGRMVAVFANLKENTQFVNHWFFNEATNIQKANVVANQLKSIRLLLEGMTNQAKTPQAPAQKKQLVRRKSQAKEEDDEHDDHDEDDDGDDELRLITNFIRNKLPHISSLGADSKRLIVKDFKRIKNLPPGNSDFHVIRNYLEIVADLPWDKLQGKYDSNKDIDLALAKEQLDADHYGLEHVKTRLIQYLVVLKLMGINAETEYDKQEQAQRAIDSEKQQKAAEEHERKKFMREQYLNESIIIPNNDETLVAHKQAKNENKKSKEMAEVIKKRQQFHAKQKIISASNKSPIIMLAGPPGVGKTSLAKSIANVLGRSFQRVSLGGVKDESEIRGHRRTYVGAMPGMIIQALRKSRSMNPVILLDEIDKVVGGPSQGAKVNGDPAAALLEVLDPEQNGLFIDHYLGFPVDLSQVMFICTANEPHNLSRPLLDRLEMIEIGAYDYSEKLVIGRKYLLPRQLKRNGLPKDSVNIDNKVLKQVILDYTREAGVRNFERKLGTICRHKAVEYAKSLDSSQAYQADVSEHDLAQYLGVPYGKLTNEIYESPTGSSKYGVVNGLSYNSDGSGSVLIFESIGFPDSNGSLNMTGRLGEVLMESAKIGLTFIKSVLSRNLLGDEEDLLQKLKNTEIHLHVPAGSISKDGPSAGITMALSFLSLILQKPVSKDIAMTGEITLRGLVLPIGGLKEKMLGASLSGIKKVIVPRENRKDVIEEYVQSINQPEKLNELLKDDEDHDFSRREPEDYVLAKYGLEVVYAREFWDVIRGVWGDALLVRVEQSKIAEYHL